MPIRKSYFPGYKGRRSAATRIQSVVRRRQSKPKISNLKLNPTVSKLVDRKITQSLEPKIAYIHYNRNSFDNLPNSANRVWQLIPRISQGVERDERTGTRVNAKALTIKGVLTIPAASWIPVIPPAPDLNADRADIQVRLLCLSSKRLRSFYDVQLNWTAQANLYSQIFKPGSNSQAPTGQQLDQWTPVNREAFTVHADKKFSMTRGTLLFPDPTSSSGAAHMPAINKKFNINVKCKNKKIYYEDETSLYPAEFQPFLIAMYSYTNGASQSNVNVLNMEYYSELHYNEKD
ncbi:MAG: coat protein [Cressdnaviricota sp.]|nr:MAG: coat protein [Cressdnaviricota sp.]